MKALRKILGVSWTSKKTYEWVLKQSWSEEGTVRHRQSKEASILWSHHEETKDLPGERDNARNNALQIHASEEGHALPGLTLRRGQDSP